jgi:AcrR family transcriptional regulator
MSSSQRRAQLIRIGRTLFAQQGIDGTSVEEIAAAAGVSKPVVYEHFGGKEGLYAVIFDREVERLGTAISTAIAAPKTSYRQVIERGAFALLDYIEDCPEGFRLISRDSAVAGGAGSFAGILSDVAAQVEDMLTTPLARHGYDPSLAAPLSQALVGMVSMAGQAWVETRTPPKELLVAELVNLAWNGLAHFEHHPVLTED